MERCCQLNNDWQDNPAQAAEIDSALVWRRATILESAIAATLPPGLYTALLAGLNNGTGIGMVEVYDRGIPQRDARPDATPSRRHHQRRHPDSHPRRHHRPRREVRHRRRHRDPGRHADSATGDADTHPGPARRTSME